MKKTYTKIIDAIYRHKSAWFDTHHDRMVLDLEEGYLFFYILTGRLVRSVSRTEVLTNSGATGTVNTKKVFYDQTAEDKFRFTNKIELKELYNQIIEP